MRVIWLSEIWHFFFGWPGVDVLVGIAAAAVAVLEPAFIAVLIPDLRKWAIGVAILAFSLTAISGKFFNDGIAVKQAEWDTALAREVGDGAKILSDAERAARNDTPDSLRNDGWNRGRRDGTAKR